MCIHIYFELNWAIAVINLRSPLEDPGAELNLILGQ